MGIRIPREQYVKDCRGSREIPPDFNGRGRRPCQPTLAIPGTEAKLLVLEQRARDREQLFHPDDAKLLIRGEDGYGYGITGERGYCRVLGAEKLRGMW